MLGVYWEAQPLALPLAGGTGSPSQFQVPLVVGTESPVEAVGRRWLFQPSAFQLGWLHRGCSS